MAARLQTRLGQMVYTLTQFPTVKSVALPDRGRTRRRDGPEADRLTSRCCPTIWVDRPAFNAAIGNPAHVTGNANVFEATFRISILDGSGKVLADSRSWRRAAPVAAGRSTRRSRTPSPRRQYGTLRVYDPSAKDGTPDRSATTGSG